jgi:hypothetical protein
MMACVHPCFVLVAFATQLMLVVPAVRGQIDIADLDESATSYARQVGAFRPTVDTTSLPIDGGTTTAWAWFVHCPTNGKMCK